MNHYQLYFYPSAEDGMLFGFGMDSTHWFRDSLNLAARVSIPRRTCPQQKRLNELAEQCREELVGQIIETAKSKGISTDKLVFPDRLTGMPPSGHLVWFEKAHNSKPHTLSDLMLMKRGIPLPEDNTYIMYDAEETMLVLSPSLNTLFPAQNSQRHLKNAVMSG